MNILHITDFHFTTKTSKQVNVVNAIIKTINDNKIKIDLIFFTGDLVFNGNKRDDFDAASEVLFNALSSSLDIKKENIIFCPGNHDIDRNAIHEGVKPYVDAKINSDESLNAFYKAKTNMVLHDSIKPSCNFNEFLAGYHPNDSENILNELYSIHLRKVKELSLGIVCLNSAWLSGINVDKLGKDDKGNLMIPTLLLDEIKDRLGKVDKKIVLIHHPLYFLKEFNFYGVENIIHNHFDLLFSGHVHKISAISRYSGSNGIFEHVAKASLTSKENLGCSLICLDEIEENKIIVREITYIEDNDMCSLGNEIIHTIPTGTEKSEIISFRKKIFDLITIEKENADKLLLTHDDENKENFLSLYSNPILKKDSEGEFETKNATLTSIDDLVLGKENYIILGKDKCGKTSLLKKIQLECLINFSRIGKIPFYFDAREFESKVDDDFNIESLVRAYFKINRDKTDQILSSDNFLLLIDNYAPNSVTANYLDEYFSNHQKIQFIICTEFNLASTVDFFSLGNILYEKLFFHDLRRKEIIAYTDKRLAPNQKRTEVQDKIIQLCKQLV